MNNRNRKKIISCSLISSCLFCLGLYLFQIGNLAKIGQEIQEKQACYQELQKTDSVLRQSEKNTSLLLTESQALGLGFIRTEQIKFIPLLKEYLAKGN